MRTCNVEGCNEKHNAKGFCKKHYKGYLREQEKNKKPKKEEKVCSVNGCKRPYACKGFCSYHYQRERNGAIRTKEERKNRKCSIFGCNEKHLAKGFCDFHYWQLHNKKRRKRLNEIQNKYAKTEKGIKTNRKFQLSDKGKIALRNGNKRRKARMRGATIELFSYEDVYKRDYYLCSICGLPVDKNLHYPDPLSITLEHIFPIAKGGLHNAENCAPAHFICNLRKGAKLISGNFEGASI